MGRTDSHGSKGRIRDVSVRRVLTLPEDAAALRRRAIKVRRIDAAVEEVITDLLDTFAANQAYGIAAPQIGELYRLIVVKFEKDPEPTVMVNPELRGPAGEIKDYDGCLSIPGIYADTGRAAQVEVRFLDRRGRPRRMRLADFPARVVQHEVDHLDGVLFIDRLDDLDDLYVLVQKEEEEAAATGLPEDQLATLRRHVRPLPDYALRWETPAPEPR